MNLDEAIEHLEANDSIMDRNITSSMDIALKSSLPPLEIINRLCNSYKGYAKMTHTIVDVMKKVDKAGSGINNSSKIAMDVDDQGNQQQSDTDQIVCECLVEIVKEQFNRLLFDELINKFSEMPAWLMGLINDPLFRKMLIELYDQNRSSTLLGVCLREISARGHHREISKVIREVDYLEVFSLMIVDIFVSIMTTYSGPELQSLIKDLKRMCCHSEYMFSYAHELLLAIEKKLASLSSALPSTISETTTVDGPTSATDALETALSASSSTSLSSASSSTQLLSNSTTTTKYAEAYSHARLKIRRVRQELEFTAVWDKKDSSASNSSSGTKNSATSGEMTGGDEVLSMVYNTSNITADNSSNNHSGVSGGNKTLGSTSLLNLGGSGSSSGSTGTSAASINVLANKSILALKLMSIFTNIHSSTDITEFTRKRKRIIPVAENESNSSYDSNNSYNSNSNNTSTSISTPSLSKEISILQEKSKLIISELLLILKANTMTDHHIDTLFMHYFKPSTTTTVHSSSSSSSSSLSSSSSKVSSPRTPLGASSRRNHQINKNTSNSNSTTVCSATDIITLSQQPFTVYTIQYFVYENGLFLEYLRESNILRILVDMYVLRHKQLSSLGSHRLNCVLKLFCVASALDSAVVLNSMDVDINNNSSSSSSSSVSDDWNKKVADGEDLTTISSSASNNNNNNNVRIQNMTEQLIHLQASLLQCKDIWKELIKTSYGVLSYTNIPSLLSMIQKHALLSMVNLRWIHVCIHNSTLTSNQAFLVLLPILLQILVTSIQYHCTTQAHDCFYLLKDLLTLTSSSKGTSDGSGDSEVIVGRKTTTTVSDAYTFLSAQKDIIDVIFFLMGQNGGSSHDNNQVALQNSSSSSSNINSTQDDSATTTTQQQLHQISTTTAANSGNGGNGRGGYVLPCLTYLLKRSDELDAVTLRHIVSTLLHSIQPPYSDIFLDFILQLLQKSSVQKAIVSVHFINNIELLNRLKEDLLKIQIAAIDNKKEITSSNSSIGNVLVKVITDILEKLQKISSSGSLY